MAPSFTSLKFTCAHQHKHLSCGGGVTIWVDVDSSVRPSVESECRAQRAVHESVLQASVKWRVEHNSSTTIWETDEENQNFQLLLLKKALVVWTKKKLFFKWLYANKRNVRSLFAGKPGSTWVIYSCSCLCLLVSHLACFQCHVTEVLWSNWNWSEFSQTFHMLTFICTFYCVSLFFWYFFFLNVSFPEYTWNSAGRRWLLAPVELSLPPVIISVVLRAPLACLSLRGLITIRNC